jgi:hypothetical protein
LSNTTFISIAKLPFDLSIFANLFLPSKKLTPVFTSLSTIFVPFVAVLVSSNAFSTIVNSLAIFMAS